MAQVDSQRAIGAVTKLLRDHLNRQGFIVSVGKPEDAADTNSTAKLNLFLYEITVDGAMRNTSLEEGKPPPVWIILRYLLTAFDDAEDSDSPDAHELLGRGMMALDGLNYLRLDNAVAVDVRQALELNPEPLKITFEDSTTDLLSKLMQGSDESYRLSAALQVRPILLLPAQREPSSLLVGVDYSQNPAAEIGTAGVGIDVIPSLGPVLERVEPARVEPGATFTIYGVDLHLSGLEAVLGGQVLRVVGQTPNTITVEADGTPAGAGLSGPIAEGTNISAGEHPLSVRRTVGSGKLRSSNMIGLGLQPVVTGAVLAGADLTLNGHLLGSEDDDIVLTLMQDGAPVASFEAAVPTANQQSVTITGVTAVGAGTYLAILRVNGQQARIAPLVVVP